MQDEIRLTPLWRLTLEAGHRGSAGPEIQWDLSAFYKWGLNWVVITPMDASLQTTIPSESHPGDSIIPLYLANLIDREDFGGEALLRLWPAHNLNLEASYTLFYTYTYTYNYHGLPIPGHPNGAIYVQPPDEDKRSLKHIGRLNVDLELPWDATLSGP